MYYHITHPAVTARAGAIILIRKYIGHHSKDKIGYHEVQFTTIVIHTSNKGHEIFATNVHHYLRSLYQNTQTFSL